MPPSKFSNCHSDFDDIEEDDPFNPHQHNSNQVSSPSPLSLSKIPIMKNSNLRNSMDSNNSLSLNDSPKLMMEAMRQITKIETPLKKNLTGINNFNNNDNETPKKSHGFVVTPFNESNREAPPSPSSEELLKRLASTKRLFSQSLNASNQERLSPKLFSKRSFDDEWKGFVKTNKNSKFYENEDSISETESTQLRSSSYQDTRSRLEKIRQKSKEILLDSQTNDVIKKKPSNNAWLYSIFIFTLISLFFFIFFGDKLVLNFIE